MSQQRETNMTATVSSVGMTSREWRRILAVVPKRTIKPILRNVMVGADSIRVTDLQTEVTLRAQNDGCAEYLVPADALLRR